MREEQLAELAEVRDTVLCKLEQAFEPRLVETYLKILEREAKLTGADTPQQVDVIIKDVTTTSTQDLEKRLAEIRARRNAIDVDYKEVDPKDE